MAKTWLIFVFMTVSSWGLYGVFLHQGQVAMADPVHGRYKAFLFVGLAYLLAAVIGSALMLIFNGSDWQFTGKGVSWSFVAGILLAALGGCLVVAGLVGAIGAFGVLLAFGAGGRPAVVMSIVFAGAPIVNAVVATLSHPPAGGWGAVRWQFVAGILLAALGGCLVMLYRPTS